MDIIIGVCVAVQLFLVLFVRYRMGRSAIGLIGFLFLGVSFFYHGITEVAQAVFPGYNPYREVAEPEGLRDWLVIVTAAMVVFTTAYLLRMGRRPRDSSATRLENLVATLKASPLLWTPVLLALGLPGFFVILLGAGQEDQGAASSSSSGLAYQFVPFLLVLAFATLCIKTRGRSFVSSLCVFAVLLVATGSRTSVIIPIVLTVSAMARYGVRVSARAKWSSVSIIALCALAITISRNGYGRFSSGEGFGTRISAIVSSVTESGNEWEASVLNDFVYRFDANSFGAYVMTGRDEGRGITGLTQLFATLSYITPSFINRNKLSLDEYLRNEESYAVQFYGLDPNLDYESDFWSLLLCYAGPWGVVVIGGILGWVVASIDSWLGASTHLSAYLVGISLSMIPVNLEQGIAYIFYILRGLPVILAAAYLVRWKWRQMDPSVPNAFRKEHIPVSAGHRT